MSPFNLDRFPAVILAAVLIALLSGGCVRERTLIQVGADGSGSIVHSKTLTYEASILMERNLELNPHMTVERFFNAEKDKFGGAELSEVKYINEFGLRGWIALYSFKDINSVTIPAELTLRGEKYNPPDEDWEQDRKPVCNRITFKYDKNSKILKIKYPEPQKFPEGVPCPTRPPLGHDESAFTKALLGKTETESPTETCKKMLSGMSCLVTVEKSGNQDKSRRLKIIDFDLDRILGADNSALSYICLILEGSGGEAPTPLASLDSKYPGILNRQDGVKFELK